MTISQSAKDAATQIGRGCQTMTCVAQTIQKAIDTETSSLRKTLVEAIARRDELLSEVEDLKSVLSRKEKVDDIR